MSEAKKTILLVGAHGTLGKAVANELGRRHTVVAAGRKSGDVRFELEEPEQIRAALAKLGKVDAVVSAAGEVAFLPLADFKPAPLGESAYTLGLKSKLLGQVNLALVARDYLRDGGSITLTSGILSDEPIVAGTSASMVNGALEAFVRAAAIELPRGLRINVVSPTVLTESLAAYGPFFRGFESVTAAKAALAFSKSVEGAATGQVYKVFG